MRIIINRKAAGLVEYGLISGLVAVVAIASVIILGEEIRNTFGSAEDTLESTRFNEVNADEINDAEEIAFAPNGTALACYDAENIGTIGRAEWAGCAGMLIVDTGMLRAAASNTPQVGGNGTFGIVGPDGNTYTFARSGREVFTGQVTDMSYLFASTSFNSDISHWDTSNVTDMSFMFYFNTAFNQHIGEWDLISLQNMDWMFYSATAFNRDLSWWNTENVTQMGSTFAFASSFNQDLSYWCVSQITVEPHNFAREAWVWHRPRPVWGTCP